MGMMTKAGFEQVSMSRITQLWLHCLLCIPVTQCTNTTSRWLAMLCMRVEASLALLHAFATQGVALGTWLRRRYTATHKLLPSGSSQLYVRTSYHNRTMLSLQSVLSGLGGDAQGQAGAGLALPPAVPGVASPPGAEIMYANVGRCRALGRSMRAVEQTVHSKWQPCHSAILLPRHNASQHSAATPAHAKMHATQLVPHYLARSTTALAVWLQHRLRGSRRKGVTRRSRCACSSSSLSVTHIPGCHGSACWMPCEPLLYVC